MKYLILITWLLSTSVVMAKDHQLAELFDKHDVKGTIILSSLDGEKTFIHNDERASLQFSTASTFKILNTLIALEEGVITNAESIIEWDGTKHQYDSWNKDQTLKSAFQVSCVWCFQQFASQIGKDKYRDYLSGIEYGRLSDEFNETTFWLDNALTISAVEQVDFLKQLYLKTLPFKISSYQALNEIMVVDTTVDYTLRAKTGWAARVTPQIGWYVGYVETKDNVWFFATNIDIKNTNDLLLRERITRLALEAKDIIRSN